MSYLKVGCAMLTLSVAPACPDRQYVHLHPHPEFKCQPQKCEGPVLQLFLPLPWQTRVQERPIHTQQPLRCESRVSREMCGFPLWQRTSDILT